MILACAAAWITEVEREALTTSGLVATVGKIAIEPGAGDVVPGRAVVSLDVRHPADRMRKAAAERLLKAAGEIATHQGLRVRCEPRLDQPSVSMDPAIAAMLGEDDVAAALDAGPKFLNQLELAQRG